LGNFRKKISTFGYLAWQAKGKIVGGVNCSGEKILKLNIWRMKFWGNWKTVMVKACIVFLFTTNNLVLTKEIVVFSYKKC